MFWIYFKHYTLVMQTHQEEDDSPTDVLGYFWKIY